MEEKDKCMWNLQWYVFFWHFYIFCFYFVCNFQMCHTDSGVSPISHWVHHYLAHHGCSVDIYWLSERLTNWMNDEWIERRERWHYTCIGCARLNHPLPNNSCCLSVNGTLTSRAWTEAGSWRKRRKKVGNTGFPFAKEQVIHYMSSFSKQIFTKGELCAWHCSCCWGYRKANKNEHPAFVEFTA